MWRETCAEQSSVLTKERVMSEIKEENGALAHSESKTYQLVQSALLIAFLVLSAQISLQFGPIPFTLQTAVICLIALVMKPKQAATIVLLYLVMGAIGLPVFSGGKAGIATLLGTSGGFLWGFVVACALGSYTREKIPSQQMAADIICVLLVLIISYICGLIQLMFVAHLSIAQAFMAAVAPFVLFDIVKASLAIGLAWIVRSIMENFG